jgi:hypothetical protein
MKQAVISRVLFWRRGGSRKFRTHPEWNLPFAKCPMPGVIRSGHLDSRNQPRVLLVPIHRDPRAAACIDDIRARAGL